MFQLKLKSCSSPLTLVCFSFMKNEPEDTKCNPRACNLINKYNPASRLRSVRFSEWDKAKKKKKNHGVSTCYKQSQLQRWESKRGSTLALLLTAQDTWFCVKTAFWLLHLAQLCTQSSEDEWGETLYKGETPRRTAD